MDDQEDKILFEYETFQKINNELFDIEKPRIKNSCIFLITYDNLGSSSEINAYLNVFYGLLFDNNAFQLPNEVTLTRTQLQNLELGISFTYISFSVPSFTVTVEPSQYLVDFYNNTLASLNPGESISESDLTDPDEKKYLNKLGKINEYFENDGTNIFYINNYSQEYFNHDLTSIPGGFEQQLNYFIMRVMTDDFLGDVNDEGKQELDTYISSISVDTADNIEYLITEDDEKINFNLVINSYRENLRTGNIPRIDNTYTVSNTSRIQSWLFAYFNSFVIVKRYLNFYNIFHLLELSNEPGFLVLKAIEVFYKIIIDDEKSRSFLALLHKYIQNLTLSTTYNDTATRFNIRPKADIISELSSARSDIVNNTYSLEFDNDTLFYNEIGSGNISNSYSIRQYLNNYDYTMRTKINNSNINNISTLQDTNVDRLDTIESNIATNTTDISNNESNINSNSSSISTITADLSQLQTRVNTNETDITSANTLITQNQNNISTLQTDVNDVETTVITIQDNIIDVENDVTDLNNNISIIENDISTLQSEVTAINTDITSIESNITDNTNDISTLQSFIQVVEQNLITAENNISDNTSEIEALETLINNSSGGPTLDLSSILERLTTLEDFKLDKTEFELIISSVRNSLNDFENDILNNTINIDILKENIDSLQKKLE
ncbi:MAG: hypothetical protein WBA74_03100 [Cyclobacteriaceae bacterium]